MTNSRIKTIVFDLDGTLYEETEHFDYLASRIENKLPYEIKADFSREYRLAANFEHPLQIGRVYDVENDLILVQENEFVKEAYHWDGQPLSKDSLKQLYPHKISYNHHSMLSIGDLWWVPISIATHYGLDGSISQQAFLETRDFMMSDQFNMEPISGLKELLLELQNHIHLALLTNSPQPDSEAILKKLGLDQIFHKKIFNGKKPTATHDWFEEMKREFQSDYFEILSIGDNEINDIKPASKLGCKTIYIDTHDLGTSTSAHYVVNNMKDALPIIQSLTMK